MDFLRKESMVILGKYAFQKRGRELNDGFHPQESMDIGISNLIVAIFGILITAVLSGLSIWISNRVLKNSQFNERNKIFIKICSDERDISEKIFRYEQDFNKAKKEEDKLNILLQSDTTLFDFYEKMAILLQEDAIDFSLFEDYFGIKIFSVYDNFMESPLFENSKERYLMYENLSNLFNSLGWSIKEKANE
jgi:hypothetical protein